MKHSRNYFAAVLIELIRELSGLAFVEKPKYENVNHCIVGRLVVSSREKAEKRLDRKQKAYEIEALMKNKRSEDYQVIEEVFDRSTLMTIYDLMNKGIIDEIHGYPQKWPGQFALASCPEDVRARFGSGQPGRTRLPC